MKRLFFTFLAFVGAVCAMTAGTVKFQYTCTEIVIPSMEVPTTGGSIYVGRTSSSDNVFSSGYSVTLDGNAYSKNSKYVMCKLDTPIAAGDVISIIGRGNGPRQEGQAFVIANDRANSTVYYVTDYNDLPNNSYEGASYILVEEGDAIVGATTLVINRDSRTVHFSSIKVETGGEYTPIIKSITADKLGKPLGEDIVITADIKGNPTPTITWYSSRTGSKENATVIAGETSNTLTVNKNTAGKYYYYCTATNTTPIQGAKTVSSDVIELDYHVATTGKPIWWIEFSNSATGSVTPPEAASGVVGDPDYEPAQNGKIIVPYMEGTEKPTVKFCNFSSKWTTGEVVGDTYVVTPELGEPDVYDIIYQEMSPIVVASDVAQTTFTEVPSWVYNPYGWNESRGVRFAKWVNDDSNMRVAKGYCHQYYFLSAAKKLMLSSSNARAIIVYVNGQKVEGITTTVSGGNIEIDLDQNKCNMVCVESDQTGGDGGFTAYAITAITPSNKTVEISEAGLATYVTESALDFSAIEGIKAYVPSEVSAARIIMTEVEKVPAGTAVLVKGTTADVPVIPYAKAPAANLFQVSNNTIADGSQYILAMNSEDVVNFFKAAPGTAITAGKCFLTIAGESDSLALEFEGEETAVSNVAEIAKVAKAIVVAENGKLLIKKADGSVVNINGAVVK